MGDFCRLEDAAQAFRTAEEEFHNAACAFVEDEVRQFSARLKGRRVEFHCGMGMRTLTVESRLGWGDDWQAGDIETIPASIRPNFMKTIEAFESDYMSNPHARLCDGLFCAFKDGQDIT